MISNQLELMTQQVLSELLDSEYNSQGFHLDLYIVLFSRFQLRDAYAIGLSLSSG